MNKREDKREHILHAGLEVLFVRGYNGTGVKDIVDAAGIPKGSFYNYFESKEDFALQAMQAVAEAGLAELRTHLGPDGRPALERLLSVYRQRIQATTDEDLRRGCLLGNLCQEMSAVSDGIRCQVNRLMQSHVQVIEDCLVEAQQAGELCTSLQADKLAEFVFDAWEGALLRAKCRQSRQPLDNFVAAVARLFTTEAESQVAQRAH